MRRWLWDRFNVRANRRLPASRLAAGVWAADPIAAALSLRILLDELRRSGRCEARDLEAWARAACLDGLRTPKHVTARRRGLTERGLDDRLRLVDARIASLIAVAGVPQVAGPPRNEVVLQGLAEAARARLRGDLDEADGLYQASAALAGLSSQNRSRALGRDRSSRARARYRAEAGLPLRVGELPIPVPVTVEATGAVLPIRYELASEPGGAVTELHRAWLNKDNDAVPLLLAHATSLIRDDDAAGVEARMLLLEIGANIFRDAESLLGVEWATSWLRTAQRHCGDNDIRTVKARRTRAHVLQLHGFLSVAAEELDRAARAMRDVRVDRDQRNAELVDLILRRSSVDVAAGGEDIANSGRRLDRAFEIGPNEGLLPGLLRNRLHLASIHDARNRQRRAFGKRRSSGYERALEDVDTILGGIAPGARVAVWDSIVVAAIRVGDTTTIRQAVDAVSELPGRAAPNLMRRLSLHLALAARLPGLAELREVDLAIPHDPLSRAELLPRRADYLV